MIRLLGAHELTSAELTGQWERRLELIARGEESRPSFMNDIVKFTRRTVEQLDALKDVKIERANLGPCPVCGKDVNENRKGYSCWSKEDPGCGFAIWKKKAGKMLPVSVAKELMESLKQSIERGDEPPTGRTAKPVTGFKGRSGRTFRAKLKIVPADEGKWRVGVRRGVGDGREEGGAARRSVRRTRRRSGLTPREELERAVVHQLRPLLGDEVAGVGDELDREVVRELLRVAAEERFGIAKSSSPKSSSVGTVSRVFWYRPAPTGPNSFSRKVR